MASRERVHFWQQKEYGAAQLTASPVALRQVPGEAIHRDESFLESV